MLNHAMLGMMKAEFEEACRAIDSRAAEHNPLKDAFQAILKGDYAERDKQCQRAASVDEARQKAKIEAWYRIGEKHGISREQASEYLKRISH